MRDRRFGGTLVPVLFLLVIVLGAGGFNYHRNWKAEQQDDGARPFHGYADADLEALAQAYREELDAWQRRAERQGRVRVADRGHIAERVAEFERVREAASQQRGLTTEVADREARLREILAEQKLRAGRPTGAGLHLARLTGLQ